MKQANKKGFTTYDVNSQQSRNLVKTTLESQHKNVVLNLRTSFK